MQDTIRKLLITKIDCKLVDELLSAHSEARRNYHLGGLRLSAVEGGRFCEAAFRILEQKTTRNFTPLGRSLETEKIINKLANLPPAQEIDAIRLHIPRALRLVYDVRNNRDAAHLADGIDPNLQDATMVIATIDWVLAEFIRVFNNINANEAQYMVNTVAQRSIPIVQDFNGFLKVLNPNLRSSDHCLVLLYQRGAHGAAIEELSNWARPEMREKLRRTLEGLNEKGYLHYDGEKYFITYAGQSSVENRRLIEPNY